MQAGGWLTTHGVEVLRLPDLQRPWCKAWLSRIVHAARLVVSLLSHTGCHVANWRKPCKPGACQLSRCPIRELLHCFAGVFGAEVWLPASDQLARACACVCGLPAACMKLQHMHRGAAPLMTCPLPCGLRTVSSAVPQHRSHSA